MFPSAGRSCPSNSASASMPRCDNEVNAGSHSPAHLLQHGRGLAQIGHATSGARSEKDHLDRDTRRFRKWHHIVRRVRERNARRESAQIDRELADVSRVRIGRDAVERLRRAGSEILRGDCIGREERGLGVHLYAEIGDDQAILERQRRQR